MYDDIPPCVQIGMKINIQTWNSNYLWISTSYWVDINAFQSTSSQIESILNRIKSILNQIAIWRIESQLKESNRALQCSLRCRTSSNALVRFHDPQKASAVETVVHSVSRPPISWCHYWTPSKLASSWTTLQWDLANHVTVPGHYNPPTTTKRVPTETPLKSLWVPLKRLWKVFDFLTEAKNGLDILSKNKAPSSRRWKVCLCFGPFSQTYIKVDFLMSGKW